MREIGIHLVAPRSVQLNRVEQRPWWDRLPPEPVKESLWERVVAAGLVAALGLYTIALGALIVGGCIAVWRSIL